MAHQGSDGERSEEHLFVTLQRLLEIESLEVRAALDQAATILQQALGADKADVFLIEESSQTLVAFGTSKTPLGDRQRALGMDRMQIVNGGQVVNVYLSGTPYITGHADQDPEELRGVWEGLAIRSTIAVPLHVAGERRGVLSANSLQVDAFSKLDLRFLEASARWVSMVLHRAELVERISQDLQEQSRRAAAQEIIRILAHDLGNYLTPLQGRLELARRWASQPGRERELNNASASLQIVQRLQRLISNLLDSSRLEQGVFSLALQPVDLAALVRETSGLLQPADTTITVLAPDELYLQADPDRLRQVLENVLTNAIKYSTRGLPITLELDTRRRDGREWALLNVRDQGPGIAPDVLPKIFQPFVSGPASGGLGLGLYLAQGIIQAHAGTLSISSQLGRGTTVEIELPLDGLGP